MKLKANALFIVIILSLVIGLLCSSVVMMGYFSRIQITRNFIREDLLDNLDSGIALLEANNDETYTTPVIVDLFDEGRDSVLLHKKDWGIFEVGSVTAFFKGDTSKKTFLMGYKPDKISKSAMWLTDNNRPLSLAGSTSITGDCYLPDEGHTIAYIEGKGIFAQNLIKGKIFKSESQIPLLKQDIKSHVIAALDGTFNRNMRMHDFEQSFPDSNSIQNGFDRPTMLLFSYSPAISLSQRIKGNVVIASKGKVVIKANAYLQDICVYANSVVIEPGFSGTVQIFAKDSIVVGENVCLKYPSAIALFKTDSKSFQPYVTMGSGSMISGLVILDTDVVDTRAVKLSFGTDAVIRGQVYVNGFADIKGDLYGNIICDRLLLETPSSTYEHHLMNATIDRTKLPAAFIGSAILPSKSRKEIVKWL